MTPVRRRPESCCFRRVDDRGSTLQVTCLLASAIAGDESSTRCTIPPAVCEACCQHPLPSGAQLNPVVASLVYAWADQAGQDTPPGAVEQVPIHQTRMFATRWLADGESNGPAESEEATPACLSGGRSARTQERAAKSPNEEPPRRLRIGLVGPCSGFGLGHQTRDLATHLGIDRWLIPEHRGAVPGHFPCRVDAVPRELSPPELEAWLEGLDLVLFVERPFYSKLTRVAASLNVRVVCIPNWEWLHPGLEWLDDVDLMLCPTRHTEILLAQWRRQFRFDWQVAHVPWPIDVQRFHFRRRDVCRRFVYVHGSGGATAGARDGLTPGLRRKGLEVLLAAARVVPRIPIVVYASLEDATQAPSNVELRAPPIDNALLYHDGDVCVQPSHWEGLGLPLLECQASGMPLITTGAPPMNEHQPLAVVPAIQEAVYLEREFCVPAARIQPEALAGILQLWHGRRIGRYSSRARRFVERRHSWRVAQPRILRVLQKLFAPKRTPFGLKRRLKASTN